MRHGEFSIRPARPGDETIIDAVLRAAFETDAEARLVMALRNDGDAVLELVAKKAGIVVGMVLLSTMKAPVGALALAPLAVHPNCQRTGIGSALVRAAVAGARDRNDPVIFVLGDSRYYTRFGFSVAAAKPFESPYSPEHMMALALRPDNISLRGEPLIYPAAFAAL